MAVTTTSGPPAVNPEMSAPTLNAPGLISGKGLTDEFFMKAGLDAGSSSQTIILVRAPLLPSFKNSEGTLIHPPIDKGLLEDPKYIPMVSQDNLPIDRWAEKEEATTRKVCPMVRANTLTSPTLGNLTAPIGQVLVSPAEYEQITFSYGFDATTGTLFDNFGKEVTLETLFFNKNEKKMMGESDLVWTYRTLYSEPNISYKLWYNAQSPFENYKTHDYWWYPSIIIGNQADADVNENKILPYFPHYTYVNNKTGRTFISINNLFEWNAINTNTKIGDAEKKPYEFDCIYTRLRSFLDGAENIWSGLSGTEEKIALILGEGTDDKLNRWEFPGASSFMEEIIGSDLFKQYENNFERYSLYITAILRGGWCWLSMQPEDNPEWNKKTDACNKRRKDYSLISLTDDWRRDGSPAGDPDFGFTNITDQDFAEVYYLYKIDRFGNEIRIDENYFVDTALQLCLNRPNTNLSINNITIHDDIRSIIDKDLREETFKNEFDPPFLLKKEKQFYDAIKRGSI